MSEIDRWVQAVQQGHKLGFAAFESWFRGYSKSKEKEKATAEMMARVFGYVLKYGLDVVFPEEGVLFELLKHISEDAYDQIREHLGDVHVGEVEMYLASLKFAEEQAITHLLGYHKRFKNEQATVLNEAVWEYLSAQDNGWVPAGDDLPATVVEILRRTGFESDSEAVATAFAERWLTAHIEAIYFEGDLGVLGDKGTFAIFSKVAALRQLGALENRDRIFELEKSVPHFFRTIIDLNADSAVWIHVKLDIDLDDAEMIVASRIEAGTFRDPHELVTRKLVSEKTYPRLAPYVVAH